MAVGDPLELRRFLMSLLAGFGLQALDCRYQVFLLFRINLEDIVGPAEELFDLGLLARAPSQLVLGL